MTSFEPRQEIGRLKKREGSVMMAVISTEPVCDRPLWRYGLESGMIGRSCHCSLKPIVADSPCPDPLIIMGVVDEPFYRIVSIG